MFVSSPEAMLELGRSIGRAITRPVNIFLIGPLGAGKTVLVKGILAGLGDEAAVTSPTFLIAKEHSGGCLPAVHIDLFRVNEIARFREYGLFDYFDGCRVVVCEWADRLQEIAGMAGVTIKIELAGESARAVDAKSKGGEGAAALLSLFGESADD